MARFEIEGIRETEDGGYVLEPLTETQKQKIKEAVEVMQSLPTMQNDLLYLLKRLSENSNFSETLINKGMERGLALKIESIYNTMPPKIEFRKCQTAATNGDSIMINPLFVFSSLYPQVEKKLEKANNGKPVPPSEINKELSALIAAIMTHEVFHCLLDFVQVNGQMMPFLNAKIPEDADEKFLGKLLSDLNIIQDCVINRYIDKECPDVLDNCCRFVPTYDFNPASHSSNTVTTYYLSESIKRIEKEMGLSETYIADTTIEQMFSTLEKTIAEATSKGLKPYEVCTEVMKTITTVMESTDEHYLPEDGDGEGQVQEQDGDGEGQGKGDKEGQSQGEGQGDSEGKKQGKDGKGAGQGQGKGEGYDNRVLTEKEKRRIRSQARRANQDIQDREKRKEQSGQPTNSQRTVEDTLIKSDPASSNGSSGQGIGSGSMGDILEGIRASKMPDKKAMLTMENMISLLAKVVDASNEGSGAPHRIRLGKEEIYGIVAKKRTALYMDREDEESTIFVAFDTSGSMSGSGVSGGKDSMLSNIQAYLSGLINRKIKEGVIHLVECDNAIHTITEIDIKDMKKYARAVQETGGVLKGNGGTKMNIAVAFGEDPNSYLTHLQNEDEEQYDKIEFVKWSYTSRKDWKQKRYDKRTKYDAVLLLTDGETSNSDHIEIEHIMMNRPSAPLFLICPEKSDMAKYFQNKNIRNLILCNLDDAFKNATISLENNVNIGNR